MMTKIKKTIPLNNNSYNIRFSQTISPFGIGSMMDFKDQTLMMATPDLWTVGEEQEIHDERLEKLLGVNKFCLPPEKDSNQKVPFVRFPRWYFCPKCKRLRTLEEWEKDFSSNNKDMITPKCSECIMKLVPAGILVACENGHIDDFPWVEWVHLKKKSGSICSNPKLVITNTSSALGLEGFTVKCKTCGAKANLKGAFGKDSFKKFNIGYKCTGNKPWSGEKEKCNSTPISIQRGALNIYFPKVVSSIVIPPYSDETRNIIFSSSCYSGLLSALENKTIVKSFGKDNLISSYIPQIAESTNIKESVVKSILEDHFRDDNNMEDCTTKEQYRVEEYNALVGNIPKECMNERDFKIEIQNDISKYKIDCISKVTLIKRMREVRALVGFSRINPIESEVISGFDDKRNNLNFVSIKPKNDSWYPAYECRGEGIFIELDNEIIEKWLDNNTEVSKRIALLNNRYNIKRKKQGNTERNITPKFVLLHTLAHLLIKELGAQCGYDSASLNERIYCDTLKETPEMSGILIYTASGDSEGTLGGLVRQGKSDLLPHIIYEAVRKAAWCSSDPVCIESTSQGRDGLNLSACHACTLISETSCEEFNTLLDRALIVGTLDNRNMGFFNKIL